MKFKEIDLLEQTQRFWEWVVGIQHWNTPEGWIARILVWLIIGYLLLLLTKHLLEIVAKISESWKSLGFQVKKSPEELARLRRRQQFCKVLASDLATLAKAESWNDQFFTDLEAEVEAEGSYYASRVDRLLRRKSHGLRRVPSLIQAIESSTEQCLLVTGDPGSGKSVALRHLANQLAEKASKSKSPDEKIPLYLNLKELPAPPAGGPSADFIREFVHENIRRGDADTAAYVRENWSVYRERGRWFFLFDSFDEIPAVLHAPTGSPAIRQHADAIRQFFEGMSACQGVLASREFKGPDALPWKRFKILPLSPARQDELIENSFLSPAQKLIAAQHTAASGPGFLTNPLFLTLLCRYIKQEEKPPTNDNELLLRHIYWLANREPDYVSRRYGLAPGQLIQGSIRLSVLFAEQPSLSLAPTQDQVSQSLSSNDVPGGDLERFLAALIDVKIGRCDVKEARAGDRRFTFAHRRYQETLFVQHLANNPSYLSPDALLTDLRWRDYTVTLLQTSPREAVSRLLATAGALLKDYARSNHGTAVIPEYGSGIHYFEWRGSLAASLLRLLQDGLSRRLDIVPQTLREAVKDYLSAPWSAGDSLDRLMVISLGGLLPEEDLQAKLEWAIRSGPVQQWDAAVTSSLFLTKMPEEMANWFRVQLADRLLVARQRADVLKLEAIAGRSPGNIGATWIVERVRAIRTLARAFDRASRGAFPLLIRLEGIASVGQLTRLRVRLIGLLQLYMSLFSLMLIMLGIALWKRTAVGSGLLTVLGAGISAKVLRHIWLYQFRAVGEPLTFTSIVSALGQMGRGSAKRLSGGVRALAIAVGSWGAVGGICHLFGWMLGYRGEVFSFYLVGPFVVLMLFGLGSFIWLAREKRRSAARFRSAKINDGSRIPLILRASSWDETASWLRSNVGEVLPSAAEARSFLRFVEAVAEGLTPLDGKLVLENTKPLDAAVKWFAQRAIARFQELEAPNRDSGVGERP